MAEKAIVSLRIFHVGASGAETRRSNAVCPGNIRILGALRPFLASAGFRFVHVSESGTEPQSPNAVFPGSIRILGRLMPFLAPGGFRGLPLCPNKGVGYGNPQF